MVKQTQRPLPRPFAFHWGTGYIVEEATYVGQYHEPTLQLLEYEDGSLTIRFCYYNHRGFFQRSPLTIGQEEIAGLREALAEMPRLRALLKEMIG